MDEQESVKLQESLQVILDDYRAKDVATAKARWAAFNAAFNLLQLVTDRLRNRLHTHQHG